MSKTKKQDLALSALTGVLFPLAFMIPHAGILTFVLLVPLFWAIENKSAGDSFKLGLFAGLIANFIGTYWLVGTLSRFGGFHTIISFVFIAFLSAYAGLSYGIFSYISSRLGFFKKPGLLSIILIASVWTSVEYFFPFLFPYGISNALSDYIGVIQIFDLCGIYGLSFIIVIVNLALMKTIKSLIGHTKVPTAEIALSIALIAGALLYGQFRISQVDREIAQAQKIKVGMVQANFDFLQKTESLEEIVTARHKEMSQDLLSVDLIIWPETAIQAWFSNDSDYLLVRDETGVPNIEGKYFIVGGMSFTPKDPDAEILTDENLIKYNTAFLTNSDSLILGRYHKVKLLLFGEYLPFSKYIPSLKNFSPASGDFTPGSELELFEIKEKNIKIAPIICYEDIIPSFSRQFVDKGANLIVNITNDAWFGKTTAPYQHLVVSIPRAVETRKYLLRSTNTGISAIIDPVGRVVSKTDTFVQTNLIGDVGIMDGEKTLYTKIGDVFPVACLIFWVGFAALERLRGKNIS